MMLSAAGLTSREFGRERVSWCRCPHPRGPSAVPIANQRTLHFNTPVYVRSTADLGDGGTVSTRSRTGRERFTSMRRWMDSGQRDAGRGASRAPEWRLREPLRHTGVTMAHRVTLATVPKKSRSGESQLDLRRLRILDRRGREIRRPNNDREDRTRLPCPVRMRARSCTVNHASVAVVGSHLSSNYWHWMTDVLGDLWMLQRSGIDAAGMDRVVLAHDDRPWQHEVFERIGIDAGRIVRPDKPFMLKVERAALVERDCLADVVPPSWLAHAVHEQLGYSPPSSPGLRLIYLSRRDAQRRGVLNEHELLPIREARGVEIHTLDGWTLEEQMQLFLEVGAVVAPHGAGMTNLLWCGNGTRVVEFVPSRWGIPCFKFMCGQLQLRHMAIAVDGPQYGSDRSPVRRSCGPQRRSRDRPAMDSCVMVGWLSVPTRRSLRLRPTTACRSRRPPPCCYVRSSAPATYMSDHSPQSGTV